MAIQSYKDLVVWQKGMELVVGVYQVTEHFPKGEQFALTNQIRRAAVPVPANIAEGHGRLHRGDFLHHLSIARGSLYEVETHLEVAMRLGYVHQEQTQESADAIQQIGRLLTGLIKSLKTDYNHSTGSGRISEWTEPYEVD